MSYAEEMFGLAGKTIAITGAGGVIAGAMAEALLKAGGSVSLWAHRKESADAAFDASTGGRGRVQTACSRWRRTRRTGPRCALRLEKTEQRFGAVDVLINCAGGNRGMSPFLEMDVEAVRGGAAASTSSPGLVVPTQVLAARWIEKKARGCIINLASMSSFIPLSGVWAYDAAKAAVRNLTMATAKEFASYGIRVNALAPGFFLGNQNRALLIDQATGELTERGRKIIAHTPFGRFGEVSELAGALLFLASEAAAGFVTGVTLPVDGGYLVDNI